MDNNSALVFTPAARQAQAERGSATAYERKVATGFPDRVTPDLAALWRDLGLRPRGEALEFDDTAPLAAIRKAITARPG